MGWISVDDRLPAVPAPVLIACDDGDVFIAFYAGKHKVECDDTDDNKDKADVADDGMLYLPEGWCVDDLRYEVSAPVKADAITHWMPLPVAPKFRE